MASEEVHKQEFRIRDLSTRSVVLFPTRAQIIRDVKSIKLQPGLNQIIIDGLAPTVDEHSIKVEGTGSATITDVSVDLIPNKEHFQDIYPSEDDDSQAEETTDESESEDEAMTAITDSIKASNIKLLAEQEVVNSAAARLSQCDTFSKASLSTQEGPAPAELEKLLSAYKEERHKIYLDHSTSTQAIEKIRAEIDKGNRQLSKHLRAKTKANLKKEKELSKAVEKKQRQKSELYKEKIRIKAEREMFWPKQTYRVTINLEASSYTPTSSRRSSISDNTNVLNLATSTFHQDSAKELEVGEISLSLSYITHSASWSPRYDLSLNTVKSTGLLEYGAELRNATSETWSNAKVTLSTSHTTFSDLSEAIPALHPWYVRLLKRGNGKIDDALMSNHELRAKQHEWARSNAPLQSSSSRGKFDWSRTSHTTNKTGDLEGRQPPPVRQGGLFGNAQPLPSSSTSFGGAAQSQPQAVTLSVATHMAKKSRTAASAFRFGSSRSTTQPQDTSEFVTARLPEGSLADDSAQTNSDEDTYFDKPAKNISDFDPAANSLTFQAGDWEESGMSTTYDIPGTKTIVPSNSASKHKIARITFRDIVFSHIIIGKLRQVAFLKARLHNTSKITLLNGPLGLTLDGSFLGQTSFPRCSAGSTFSLPLGVDPSLTVSYSKPTVRRSQFGLISKQDSNVFKRSLVITNTKPIAISEVTVLDQVPVSEDERLRVDILSPAGLKVGGQPVRAGIEASITATSVSGVESLQDKRGGPAKEGGNGGGKGTWGSAVATAKKGGEVVWNVKLSRGCGVRLELEYECLFPGGDWGVAQGFEK